MRRIDHLVEGLVRGDHAEIVAGAFFESRQAVLQVPYFGLDLGIALYQHGIFGALVLFASLPVLRPLVLSFSSPEFFILTLWGVSMVGILSGNAPIKGLLAGILGVLISTVGLDAKSGIERFSFNVAYFWEGIDLVLVALGIFAIPEVIDLAGRKGAIAKAEDMKAAAEELTNALKEAWAARLAAAAAATTA